MVSVKHILIVSGVFFMKQKGAISTSLETVIFIMVVLIVIFGIAIVATGKIDEAKNIPGSSGNENSDKFDACRESCNDPTSIECTKVIEDGISCAKYLENQNRKLIVTYSPSIISKSTSEIFFNIKTSDGAEPAVDISGTEVSDFTKDGAIYKVILNPAKMTGLRLIEGTLYIVVYVKAAGYPQRVMTISVHEVEGAQGTVGGDIGGGAIGGDLTGGGSKANTLTFKQNDVITSSLKADLPTKVLIDGVDAQPDQLIKISLKTNPETILCSGLSCINPFIIISLLPNALSTGMHTLTIAAQKEPSSEPISKDASFSWKCPSITLEGKIYPGNMVYAIFESPIHTLTNVRFVFNDKEIMDKQTVGDAPTKVSFKLPVVGKGFRDGGTPPNVLRIDRSDGLCKIGEKTSNYFDGVYSWSCVSDAPSSGCYEKDGKQYLITGKGGYGYTDSLTGCEYSTLGMECKNGCSEGKCNVPDVKIESVKLDGKDVIEDTLFEDRGNDRILTVTVKNEGTFTATDVFSGIIAKLDGEALSVLGGVETDPKKTLKISDDLSVDEGFIPNNLNDIDVLSSSEYFFAIGKDKANVGVGKTSIDVVLSITAKASNAENTVSWSKDPLTIYSCGVNCGVYGITEEICNSCEKSCLWDDKVTPNVCKSTCGLKCGTRTYATCPGDCPECKWDAPNNVCIAK